MVDHCDKQIWINLLAIIRTQRDDRRKKKSMGATAYFPNYSSDSSVEECVAVYMEHMLIQMAHFQDCRHMALEWEGLRTALSVYLDRRSLHFCHMFEVREVRLNKKNGNKIYPDFNSPEWKNSTRTFVLEVKERPPAIIVKAGRSYHAVNMSDQIDCKCFACVQNVSWDDIERRFAESRKK